MSRIAEIAARIPGYAPQDLPVDAVNAFLQQLINLVIVILGVYMIGERQLTMGGLIACTMLASRAMAPVGQVGRQLPSPSQ